MKWSNGTTWIGLGWSMEGADGSCSLAIDPSSNKPVVIFNDSTTEYALVHVSKHPYTLLLLVEAGDSSQSRHAGYEC